MVVCATVDPDPTGDDAVMRRSAALVIGAVLVMASDRLVEGVSSTVATDGCLPERKFGSMHSFRQLVCVSRRLLCFPRHVSSLLFALHHDARVGRWV